MAVSDSVGDPGGVGVELSVRVGLAEALGATDVEGLAEADGRGVTGRGVAPGWAIGGTFGCGVGLPADGEPPAASGSVDDVAAALGGCEDPPVPPSTA